MSGCTVPMALMDFVPVILFGIASLRLGTDLKRRTGLAASLIYIIGSALVMSAGTLKALFKLVLAVSGNSVEWLTNQFFPNQALGFMLIGIGLACIYHKDSKTQKNTALYSVIPVFVLVGTMTAGMILMYITLFRYAVKLKRLSAVLMFTVSFILCFGMGYLSSKDFSTAAMNWITQGVNTVAQTFYLIAVLLLHKSLSKDENF